MSEPSYPSPCRSQSCGKTLYGPVTYCPYCGCKIESATEASKERKGIGQITEIDDKVVGAVGYPHTPGHLPLSSNDGDGDVSSQPVPAYVDSLNIDSASSIIQPNIASLNPKLKPVYTSIWPWKKVMVAGACLLVVLVILYANWGRYGVLVVVPEPGDAGIYVDGVYQKHGLVRMEKLSPGKRIVVAKLSGYADEEKTAEVISGREINVTIRLTPLLGALKVATDPTGAEISINGVEKGKSPVEITGLTPGTANVRATRDGYTSIKETVNVIGGEMRQVDWVLEKVVVGTLKIITEPSGAEISVNGIVKGKTPLEIKDIKPGTVKVLASMNTREYATREEQVNIEAGQDTVLKWDLMQQVGTLKIFTEPSGAEISVNGIVKGKTPLEIKDIKPGTAKVRASMNTKEYAIREEQVNIEAGREPKMLEWTLTQLVGSLRVRVRPVAASIYVENELKGTGGVELAGIGAGTIRVKAVLEGYVPQEKRVEIVPGREMPLEMDLSPSGPKIGDMWKDPVTGMVFMWVPGGCYQMGCGWDWDGDCQNNEKPVHDVCVDGFWMGQTEVTQGQWQRVIPGSNPSNFKKGDNYPVEQVSWEDAKEYIRKLNGMGNTKFRLPSEAEWEYAARSGGKAEVYSGGSDLDGVAWYSGNSGNSTHQVKTKKGNGLGIYDMSGNVWEWCEDVYIADIYSRSDKKNPIYNSGGPLRVLRGGGWHNEPICERCAYRNDDAPAIRYFSLGFRLLRML